MRIIIVPPFFLARIHSMMKPYHWVLVWCLVAGIANAQTINDAARFAAINPTGTARHVGVGSSMGVMGADFGALSQNPAGIGAFRWSEFNFTPAFSGLSVNSKFLSGTGSATDQTNKFLINNVGLVSVTRPQRGKWKTSNFAIGLNRLANYNRNFSIMGRSTGSITQRWVQQASYLPPDALGSFETLPAYVTGAIYDFDENYQYESDYDLNPSAVTSKQQVVSASGGMSELLIGLGANYDEKLLIGATVNIPFVNYEVRKTYQEDDDQNEIPYFEQLQFEEYVRTDGSGIHAKFGATYLLNEQVRVGASFHTPSVIKLNDTYTTDLTFSYQEDNNIQTNTENSPQGEYSYSYVLPMRAQLGVGILLGKNGFISTELAWVPYQNAKFRFKDDKIYEGELNAQIQDALQNGYQVRAGAEWVLGYFRVRGGIQVANNPYSSETGYNTGFSTGAGVRGNKVFFDVAYRYQHDRSDYSPYQLIEGPGQNIENTTQQHLVMGTLGIKF